MEQLHHIKKWHDFEQNLEKYNNLKVETLVIEHCLCANFLSLADIDNKSRKYLWVNEAIKLCLFAIHIKNSSTAKHKAQNITPENIDAHFKAKQDTANKIAELVAQKLLICLPEYRE